MLAADPGSGSTSPKPHSEPSPTHPLQIATPAGKAISSRAQRRAGHRDP
jgi:hypothetical protein